MGRHLRFILSLVLILAVMAIGSRGFAQGGTWTTKAPMPTARAGGTAAAVNGILYVAGGVGEACSYPCAKLEAYDPAADAWTSKAPMPTARYGPAAGVVNGILYVAGGGCLTGTCGTLEAYDATTNTWTTRNPMPTARSYAAAGAVNGILYVAGGGCLTGTCGTLEAYDPATDTWTTKAPMPSARWGAAAGVVNGLLYLAGGGGACPSLVCATLLAYDPATNTWTTKAPMPTARYWAAAGTIDGILYVAGGYCPSAINYVCATLEAYDPATNTWRTRTPMSRPRWATAADSINDTLYVVGGNDRINVYATNEAFTTQTVVAIDIRPGDIPNSINTRSHGLIPVAILSSTTFDAPTVANISSVKFGRTGNESSLAFCNASGEDVNFDGLLDLVCHFFTQQTGFRSGDTIGVLTGQTVSGMGFRGTDPVRIVR